MEWPSVSLIARVAGENIFYGGALFLLGMQLGTAELGLGISLFGGIVSIFVKLARTEQRHAMRLASIASDVKEIKRRTSRLEGHIFKLPALADPTPMNDDEDGA